MKQTDRNALLNWEALKESIIKATPVDRSMTYTERERHRAYLEAHPLEWIVFFFGIDNRDEFAEFADFHKRAIQRIVAHDEWYEVISWSRELAKSTVVMFTVLYLVLTGRKRNVILTSNTKDNAIKLLEPYRAHLEFNERIKAYYGIQQNIGSWAEDYFVTKSKIAFRALGAGESPRGTRYGNVRPDVLLVDDFDTDKDCLNPDIIDKRWDWWERALYPTRSVSKPTLVVFCGNIIAKDCCAVRAGEIADHWDIINIRDREGRSVWPQKNTEEHIDRVLSKMSTKAAQGEYFNNPVSEGEIFKAINYDKVPPLSKFKFLVIYGDPAPGENKSKVSSTKAAILLGKLKGKLYIIRTKLDRGLNAEFIDWYVELLDMVDTDTPVYCYMENNKLQDPFFQQVFQPLVRKVRRERRNDLYIRGDEKRKAEKFARIEANLEPMSREGNLIFNEQYRDDPHMKRLEEQFLLLTPRLKFPTDGPDCVEGGNRIIDDLQRREEPPVKMPRKMIRTRNKYRL
ncbi:hypothetical protein HMPREF0663_11897 [Hoylesella oralis ATCC 33269]|uniref:Phage terminase, large subunit n=1 Tax=Hoylesella oralis ATCC 33269 TaxID=873533 RepID=E7RRU6_9BACT|nr:hypothetical protein [Hoylesella oralis]EFZ36984.1 hypothetical protein HMPREF0663_11897 [Hoylesella oralis ATCC 33269]EPH18672.1 hypothetical protein HMPREF1475_00580 [Hoylesella oralis HGA0225]SHF78310.1 hypothetical protein SAMN05444288_1533 [Hoylesella oralis]